MSMKKIVSGMMVVSLMFSASEALAALEKVGVVGLAGKDLVALDAEGKSRGLKTGDDIFLNDEVTSGADKGQLIFLDRSTLTVNPGSKVKVDTFVYDPAASTGKLAFSNFKGAVRFVGGKLSKKQPVTMKTPVATIGIRGGILDTHVTEGTGATDSIFVFGDEMSMTNANGETVTTTERGTGFNLATATGTPTALPPEVVQQHLNQFEPVGGAMEGAPSSEDVDEGMDSVSATTETSAANGGGDNSGSGAAALSDANANTDASGDDTTASASESTDGTANTTNAAGEKVPDAFIATVDGLGGAGIETVPAVGNVGQDQFNNTLQQEVQALVTEPNTASLPTSGIISSQNLKILAPVINEARLENNQEPRNDLGEEGGVNPNQPVNPEPALPPIADSSSSTSSSSTSSSGGSTSSSSTSSSTSSSSGAMFNGRYFNFEDATMVDGDYIDPGEKEVGNISASMDASNYSITTTPVPSGTAETQLAPINFFMAAGGVKTLTEGNNDFMGVTDFETFERGVTYRNASGSMYYFHFLDDTAEPMETPWYKNEVMGVMGKGVGAGNFATAVTTTAGNASSNNGIVFYDILPDIAKFGNTENGTDWGLMDYNIVDPALVTGMGVMTPQLPLHEFGVAVDYQNKKFITGFLEFKSETTGYGSMDNSSSAKIGFGDVNTAGVGGVANGDGAPYLNGVFLQYKGFDSINYAGSTYSNYSGGKYGETRVGHNLYTDGSGNVDGMIMNIGVAPNTIGGGLFDPANSTNSYHEQGITQSTAPSGAAISAVTAANRQAGEYKGFVSGLMVVDPTGLNPETVVYQSQDANNVQLVVGDSGTVNGNVGASFRVKNLGDMTTNTDNSTYTALFGKVAPGDPTPGANAYLSNKLYAAQMKEYLQNSSSGATTVADATATKSSFLASGGTMMQDSVNVSECTSCTYTHWGVWAGEFNAGATKVPNMIPYLVGKDVTQVANLPTAGNYNDVVYSGNAYANFSLHNASGLKTSNEVGTVNAQFDLGDRRVDNMSINFANVGAYGGQDLNVSVGTINSVIAPSGVAAFAIPEASMNVSLGGTPIAAVDVHDDTNITGAFFGNAPGDVARELGGNFAVGFMDPMYNEYRAGGVYQARTPTGVAP